MTDNSISNIKDLNGREIEFLIRYRSLTDEKKEVIMKSMQDLVEKKAETTNENSDGKPTTNRTDRRK